MSKLDLGALGLGALGKIPALEPLGEHVEGDMVCIAPGVCGPLGEVDGQGQPGDIAGKAPEGNLQAVVGKPGGAVDMPVPLADLDT